MFKHYTPLGVEPIRRELMSLTYPVVCDIFLIGVFKFFKEKIINIKALILYYILLSSMENECSICFEIYENECKTNCNHSFCEDCLHKWFKKKKISCPICREDIKYYILDGEEYEVIFNRKMIL